MQRIAVGLEYDGAAYCGWQTQANGPAIQPEVEAALSLIADAPIAVVCAGRTDAGVHALGQVLHFDTIARRPMRAWVMGSNRHLSRGIALQWAREVPAHFHARYSATARTYRYLILNRSERPALAAGRVAWVHQPLNVEYMRDAAASLVGEHDFSAFRAKGCQAKSPVRRVHSLDVDRVGAWVSISVTANAFLHHMVRNIAGLLLAVGQGDVAAARVAELLASRNRAINEATAPADGVYFAAVRYPAAFGLPAADSAMIPAFAASSG